MRAEDLWQLDAKSLAGVLRTLHPVKALDVRGFAYRGVSLGLPRFIERLSWKTFMKAFVADGDRVRGFNVRLHQDGLDAPPRPKEKRGAPVSFGHFAVIERERELLLDYGAYAKPLEPFRWLRDPLRALNEGDASTLVGMSYLEVLGRRIDTPSYFTLERIGPLTFDAPPAIV